MKVKCWRLWSRRAGQDRSAEAVQARHEKVRPTAEIVTDGLRPYSAAMKEVGNADRQEVGGRLNNRAENSHQPFRRRERAMLRFRSMKTLQKFSSVHAQERDLVTRSVYKQRRSAALAGVARSRGLNAA